MRRRKARRWMFLLLGGICFVLPGCDSPDPAAGRSRAPGAAACYCGGMPFGPRYCRYRTPWECDFVSRR